MKDKKVIILIILGIGALISLIYGITVGPKTRKASPRLESAPTTEAISVARRIVPTERKAAKTDFIAWGRNPFVQKESPGAKVSKLVLGGIMWNVENPKAMINNEIVGIGDKVGGNTVVDIKKNSVTVNDGTEDFVLRLEY